MQAARMIAKLALAAFFTIAGATPSAYADLVSGVVLANAPQLFAVTIDDTTLAAAALTIPPPGPVDWGVTVTQGTFDGVGQNNDLRFAVVHIATPHAGEFSLALPAFDLNNVEPGKAILATSFSIAHGGHRDFVTVDYIPTGVAKSTIRLTAEHDSVVVLATLLLDALPKTQGHAAAAKIAQSLSAADAGRVATKMLQLTAARAQKQVQYLMKFHKMAMKGGKTAFHKAYGTVMEAAINLAFANLLAVMKDPCSKEGKTQLQGVLTDQNGMAMDLNKALDLIDKLCVRSTAIKRAKQNKGKKAAKGNAPNSVAFDFDESGNGNSILSFSDATIELIEDLATGNTSTSDIIVGAIVEIPNYKGTLLDNGFYYFENTGGAIIVRQPGLGGLSYLEMEAPFLIYDGVRFEAYTAELVLEGAPATSPFDDGLASLGSGFVADLLSDLTPFEYQFFSALTVDTASSLTTLTNGFTQDTPSSVPYTLSIELADEAVPSVPTLGPGALVILAGVVGTLGTLAVRRRRGAAGEPGNY